MDDIEALVGRGGAGWGNCDGCRATTQSVARPPDISLGTRRRFHRNLVSLNKDINMSILAWIVLGLIAGFIGSKIVNKTGEGFVLDIILGIIGAVVGGYLFNMFGAAGVTGVNIYSLFVAVIGAVLVLVVYHAVRRPA